MQRRHKESTRQPLAVDCIPCTGTRLVLMLHPREHCDLAELSDELAASWVCWSLNIARYVQALSKHLAGSRLPDRRGRCALHVWFSARPDGQAQLSASWMVIWDGLRPEYPADADAPVIVNALIASYGGTAGPESVRTRSAANDAHNYEDP
jgi:hypothetical protein